jgi:hypothetical protein
MSKTLNVFEARVKELGETHKWLSGPEAESSNANVFAERAKQLKDNSGENVFVKRAKELNGAGSIEASAERGDESRGFMPAFKQGAEGGVSGLLMGNEPQRLPEDSTWPERIGATLGGVVSDYPAMIPGAAAGAAIGGPIGGVAGAFALPSAIKSSFEEYRKFIKNGNNLTFGEFLEHASKVGKETGKSALIGGVTGFAGQLLPILKLMPGSDKLLGTRLGTAVAKGGLELGGMTGAQSAIERRLPDKEEVVNNALVLAGLKAAHGGGELVTRKVPEALFTKGKELGDKLTSKIPGIKGFKERYGKQKQFFDVIRGHVGERNAKYVESQFKWRDALSESEKDGRFTEQNLEDMMFYRQKTANPLRKGDTFEALRKRLPESAKSFVDNTVSEHLKNSLKEWNENPSTKNINPRDGLEEIYLPGLYKYEPGKFEHAYEEVSKQFKTKNPFSNEKTFLNYMEAFSKQGLTPRYRNIVELMRAYDKIMIKSMANSELVSKIKDMERKSDDNLVVNSTNEKAYAEAKRAGYVPFHDYYLRRQYEKGQWNLSDKPALVHPDFAPAAQGIFNKRQYQPPTQLGRAYDLLSNQLRYAHVRFSPFHRMSLMGHAWDTIGSAKALKYQFDRWSRDVDALRNNKEFMADAARSGLVVHEPIERYSKDETFVSKSMDKVIDKIPEKIKDSAAADKIAKLYKDHAGSLFKKYHPRLKIATWKNFVDSEVNKLISEGNSPSEEQVSKIKKDMADLTNNIFGGQNWELSRVFNDPRNMKWLRRVIGYPDWTTSAIRNAASAFAPGETGAVARKTWLRYGINFMLMQSMMKFLMSGWKNKDEKDPSAGIEFDAEKGFKGLHQGDPSAWYKFPLPDINVKIGDRIFNPGRDVDTNRKLYSHTGKQALEIGGWLNHQFNEFFSKSNPVIQAAWKQITAITPYEDTWFTVRGKRVGRDMKPWDASKPNTIGRFVSRAKELAGEIAPFGVRSIWEKGPATYLASGAGAVPISKGLSLYSAEEYIEKAIKSKDNAKLNNIKQVLKDNGYSDKQIKSTISRINNRLKKT